MFKRRSVTQCSNTEYFGHRNKDSDRSSFDTRQRVTHKVLVTMET